MKKIFSILSLLIFIPGIALAQWGGDYFGKDTVNTGNLNISVDTFRTVVPVVGLENKSPDYARCSATFSHDPLFSETRSTTIAPGKRATLAYRVHAVTARIDIQVNCTKRMQG